MTGLTPEVAVLGIALGLVFSLICYLLTNLSPGGMITPGWLALTLVTDLRRIFLIGVVILLTYFGTRLLQRVVILYGKRLFASVVLLAVFLQMTLFLFFLRQYPLLFTHETLGFIVPGLIAYQLLRQPKVATLLSTTIVTALAYVVLLTGVLLRLLPGAG
ncbi:MAG: poly-gamma-glutamate biosynthesis protein PgsC/CapC [Actinomycetes bacterium]